MKVSELMSRTVISVPPEATASALSRLLSRHHIGAAPVIDGRGRLRGIVTDRDVVLRCVAREENPELTPVREIMTRDVSCIAPDADLKEAAEKMASDQIRRLPVTAEGHVVGMLSLGDMARSRACSSEAAGVLSDISFRSGLFSDR